MNSRGLYYEVFKIATLGIRDRENALESFLAQCEASADEVRRLREYYNKLRNEVELMEGKNMPKEYR